MMSPTISFVKLVPDAILPSYAKAGDAGMDLRCTEKFVICPGERLLVKCGLACAIPLGWEGQVRSRSGNALKKGVVVLNSPGTIDSGYRGELGALLYNCSEVEQYFNKSDAVAQLVISPIAHATIAEASSLPDSDRGTGGFGSTGA